MNVMMLTARPGNCHPRDGYCPRRFAPWPGGPGSRGRGGIRPHGRAHIERFCRGKPAEEADLLLVRSQRKTCREPAEKPAEEANLLEAASFQLPNSQKLRRI